jgi:hypothetical protein
VSELTHAEQSLSETVDSFAARLHRLANLAQLSPLMMTSFLCPLFINHLRDTYTRRRLQEIMADDARRVHSGKKPRLVDLAACVAAAHGAEQMEAPTTRNVQPQAALIAHVVAAPAAPPAPVAPLAPTPTDSSKEMGAMTAKLDQLTAAIAALSTKAAADTARPPRSDSRDGRPRDNSRMTCYNCSKMGHRISECPQPRDNAVIDRNIRARKEQIAAKQAAVAAAASAALPAVAAPGQLPGN